MDKVFNLLIVGVGGQGTILASNIVTQAAMNAGLDAKKSEIHGMSQRGGAVFSHVRFGKKVYSPVIAKGNVDVLISLEEMETLRWTEFLNKDSQLIVLITEFYRQIRLNILKGLLIKLNHNLIMWFLSILKNTARNWVMLNILMYSYWEFYLIT